MPQDEQVLLNFFDNVFRDLEEPFRIVLERTWFRNILYYLGEQWLSWLEHAGTFASRYGLNYGVPTPVSNIIRDFVKSGKALVLNKQYTASVWPNSEEQKDKDAAETGDFVLKWLNTRNEGEIEDVKDILAMWILLSGNGFTRTFAEVQGNGFVLDASGKPVSRADVAVDCIIPFNVRVGQLGTNLRKKKWVGCKNLCYREWVEDTYGVKLDTRSADMRQIDYQRQLLTLVSNVSPWKGRSIEFNLLNTDIPSDEMVVVNDVEWRPDKEYPNGRYAVHAEGIILRNDDHLPISVKDGKWYYTFDHFPYNYTPGGFWASGGVDDLISPQNIINEIDQALAINRKSVGRPVILAPSDLVLKRMSERGQALLAVKYDAKHAMGGKVQIQHGTPYPEQVIREREMQKEVAQEASGDPKNVLRGKAPYAGAPGIAIDILRETAEQSHGPDIRRFYRNWNRVERKRLILVSELFKENRLIKIRGEGNDVKVRRFKGADLHGNVDVHLELDSGLSSTNTGKNQFLLNLIQYGFWHPQTGPKPDVRRELLRRFGMAGFPEEENLHMSRAELENSKIMAQEDLEDIALPPIETEEIDPQTGGPLVVQQDDPVFAVDDHFIHIVAHDKVILSPEFKTLKKNVQMVLLIHREYHAAKLTEEVAAEQGLQQAGGRAGVERGEMLGAEGEEQAAVGGIPVGPGGEI